jgi:serine/threonine-protein kinase
VLNSLSWRRALVQPKPIDAQQTVLAFDLRELDWDLGDQWSEALRGGTRLDAARKEVRLGYPYGVTHEQYPEDDGFNRDARDVYRMVGTKMPAVRADWFVAFATQPPAYHNHLRLPENAGELEKQLRVNVAANYHRDHLARSGFKESGVSQQNRLVERHEAAFGAYWKSSDFKDDTGAGNLINFPLGRRTGSAATVREAGVRPRWRRDL